MGEDCNYDAPFVGKSEVGSMVEDYDLGGIEWILENASTGKDACCFTWKIKIKGGYFAEDGSYVPGRMQGQLATLIDLVKESNPAIRGAFEPAGLLSPQAER